MVIYYYQGSNHEIKYSNANKKWLSHEILRFTVGKPWERININITTTKLRLDGKA